MGTKTLLNRFIKGKKFNFRLVSLPLILLLMWGIIFFLEPVFLTYNNLSNLGRQTTIIAIMAIGQTFVIITKGIDLSVGSTLGLTCVVSALLFISGVPIIATILIVTALGILIGLVNGVFVYDAQITPFIATLGTMTMVRGVAFIVSDGHNISGLPRDFSKIINSEILGIPVMIIILVVIATIFMIILKYTLFGRQLYAIGSNNDASRLSGVNVRWTTYGAYMVSGGLSAVAGLLMTARLASGVPSAGQMYELDSIASSVIGGASLFGAQGSVIGSVIGSLIMTTLRNAGNLLGIQPFWLQVAIGALLVIVVFIDQLQKRNS